MSDPQTYGLLLRRPGSGKVYVGPDFTDTRDRHTGCDPRYDDLSEWALSLSPSLDGWTVGHGTREEVLADARALRAELDAAITTIETAGAGEKEARDGDGPRETLPEHLARAYPDGPPGDLTPVRLVPVAVFGADECDACGHPQGYGQMDAAEAWSDCNRARGKTFRRDEERMHRRADETVVVWATPGEAAKLDRVLGDIGRDEDVTVRRDVPDRPPSSHYPQPAPPAEPATPAQAAARAAFAAALGEAMENVMLYGTATPPAAWPRPVGLPNPLGGAAFLGNLPGDPRYPRSPTAGGPDPFAGVLGAFFDAEERRGGPLPRSRWAPAGCTCPWPWPTDGRHVRQGCPHYAPPPVPDSYRASPQVGCRQVDGTTIHGRPHTCPQWMQG